MSGDPELAALIEQAARNLKTLELLTSIQPAGHAIEGLRQRVQALRDAYTKETDALTRQVLSRAIERRRGIERRRQAKNIRPVT